MASLVAGLSGRGAWAGELTLRDGSKVQGNLVTMVLKTPEGGVVQASEGDVLLYVAGTPSTTSQGGAWGSRLTPVAPGGTIGSGDTLDPSPPALDPQSTRLEILLEYRAPVETPDAADAPALDAGELGEVFAYLPGQDGMRYAWIPLGNVRRVENVVVSSLTDDQELALLRGMLQNPEFTDRAAMVAKLASEKAYTHQMRYVMDGPVQLPAGAFTVHVGLPKIRRHRKFPNVSFRPGTQVRLEYAWSQHSQFGR
jgi:hypothetical protein